MIAGLGGPGIGFEDAAHRDQVSILLLEFGPDTRQGVKRRSKRGF